MNSPLLPESKAAQLLGISRHKLADIARRLNEQNAPERLLPLVLCPGSQRPNRRYPSDQTVLLIWLRESAVWLNTTSRRG
jgi:hypothetical protein